MVPGLLLELSQSNNREDIRLSGFCHAIYYSVWACLRRLFLAWQILGKIQFFDLGFEIRVTASENTTTHSLCRGGQPRIANSVGRLLIVSKHPSLLVVFWFFVCFFSFKMHRQSHRVSKSAGQHNESKHRLSCLCWFVVLLMYFYSTNFKL